MTKLDHYESALLTELRTHVTERQATHTGRRRTWRRLAYAGVAAAAVAGISVVALPSGGMSPAFAVTEEPDGDVRVTINRLEDPSALEEALAERGISADVTYQGLPSTEVTTPPSAEVITLSDPGADFTFSVPFGMVSEGETLVVSMTKPSDSEIASDGKGHAVQLDRAQLDVVEGAVQPCTVVDIPDPVSNGS